MTEYIFSVEHNHRKSSVSQSICKKIFMARFSISHLLPFYNGWLNLFIPLAEKLASTKFGLEMVLCYISLSVP